MDQNTNPRIRTGRCFSCGVPAKTISGRRRPGRAAVYQWAFKKGRELHRAWCPACGEKLAQTTAANLKHYFLGQREPIFSDSREDAQKEFQERKLAKRGGAYTAVQHAPHAIDPEDDEDGAIQRATSGQLRALGREGE